MSTLRFEGIIDMQYAQRFNYAPIIVPCPIVDDDVEAMATQIHIARDIFEYLCPTAAKVLDVAPIMFQKKCAWKVQYCPNVQIENMLTKREILRQIRFVHPQNATITLEIPITYPPALEIHYSLLDCKCSEKFREAEKLSNEFANIQIDEN